MYCICVCVYVCVRVLFIFFLAHNFIIHICVHFMYVYGGVRVCPCQCTCVTRLTFLFYPFFFPHVSRICVHVAYFFIFVSRNECVVFTLRARKERKNDKCVWVISFGESGCRQKKKHNTVPWVLTFFYFTKMVARMFYIYVLKVCVVYISLCTCAFVWCIRYERQTTRNTIFFFLLAFFITYKLASLKRGITGGGDLFF